EHRRVLAQLPIKRVRMAVGEGRDVEKILAHMGLPGFSPSLTKGGPQGKAGAASRDDGKRPPMTTPPLPDAAPDTGVDRLAPEAARPWLKLARFDRPAGIWLLLLPGWQGIALAAAMN